MGEKYISRNEPELGREEYLKSYKFLNSAYKKLADGELSNTELRKLSEEKAIYEHSRLDRQALSREVVLQSIKSHPDYPKYKEELDKHLSKVKGGVPEEQKSFFSFFTQQPEVDAKNPVKKEIIPRQAPVINSQLKPKEIQEPSIWERLFSGDSNSQVTPQGNIDDPKLREILRGRKEKRVDKAGHTYRQTMCAAEGAEAFKYLTGIELPGGDALDKFRNMKHLGWTVQGDGKNPLDVSSIPTSGAFCIGTPSWSAKNAKYGHFVTGKDGYVFDAFISKEPIPIRQYAQMKSILFAYNPKA